MMPADAVERVEAVMRTARIDHGQLVPLPAGAKRLVLSDRTGVVVRAAKLGDSTLCDPVDELAWAARIGAVVQAQLPIRFSALDDGELVMTVWRWVPGVAPQNDAAASHGSVLRRLHDRGNPSDPPRMPPGQTATARERVKLMPPGEQRASIVELLDVADTLLEASEGGPPVLCHGDAHDRNIVVGPDGVVLVDFDSSTVGPRALDVASGLRAWSSRGCGDAFLDGYGHHADVQPDILATFMWIRDLRGATTRAHAGEDVVSRLERLAATSPVR